MILGVGKCLVALIEATRLYFSLKAFWILKWMEIRGWNMMKSDKKIKLQFAKDIIPKNRDEVQFSVGKCGRGYPVKFLGIRELDGEKTCPHCK